MFHTHKWVGDQHEHFGNWIHINPMNSSGAGTAHTEVLRWKRQEEAQLRDQKVEMVRATQDTGVKV
jgi:hypothetical protein